MSGFELIEHAGDIRLGSDAQVNRITPAKSASQLERVSSSAGSSAVCALSGNLT